MNPSRVVSLLLVVVALVVLVVALSFFLQKKEKPEKEEAKSKEKTSTAPTAPATPKDQNLLHVVTYLREDQVPDMTTHKTWHLFRARSTLNYTFNNVLVTVASSDVEENPAYQKYTHKFPEPFRADAVVFDNSSRHTLSEVPVSEMTVYWWSRTVLLLTFKTTLHGALNQYHHFSAHRTPQGYLWLKLERDPNTPFDVPTLVSKLEEVNTTLGNGVALNLDESLEQEKGTYTTELGGTTTTLSLTKKVFDQQGFLKLTHKVPSYTGTGYRSFQLKKLLVAGLELPDLDLTKKPAVSLSVYWWYSLPLLAELELRTGERQYLTYSQETNSWLTEVVPKLRTKLTQLRSKLSVPVTLELSKKPTTSEETYTTNDVLVRVSPPETNSPRGFPKYTHRFLSGEPHFVGEFHNLGNKQWGLPVLRVTEVSVYYSTGVPLLLELSMAGSGNLSSNKVYYSNNGFGFWLKVPTSGEMLSTESVLMKLDQENKRLVAENDKYVVDVSSKTDYMSLGKAVGVEHFPWSSPDYKVYKHVSKAATNFKFHKLSKLGRDVETMGLTELAGVRQAYVFWFLDNPLLVKLNATPLTTTPATTPAAPAGNAAAAAAVSSGAAPAVSPVPSSVGSSSGSAASGGSTPAAASGQAGGQAGERASQAASAVSQADATPADLLSSADYYLFDGQTNKWAKADHSLFGTTEKLKQQLDRAKLSLGTVTVRLGHGAGEYVSGPVKVTVSRDTEYGLNQKVFDKMVHQLEYAFTVEKLNHFYYDVKPVHEVTATPSSTLSPTPPAPNPTPQASAGAGAAGAGAVQPGSAQTENTGSSGSSAGASTSSTGTGNVASTSGTQQTSGPSSGSSGSQASGPQTQTQNQAASQTQKVPFKLTDFVVKTANVYVYKYVPLVVELVKSDDTKVLLANTFTNSVWEKFTLAEGSGVTTLQAKLEALRTQLTSTASVDVCKKLQGQESLTYELPKTTGQENYQVSLTASRAVDGSRVLTHVLPDGVKLASLRCADEVLTGLDLDTVKKVFVHTRDNVPLLVKTNSDPKYFKSDGRGTLTHHPLPEGAADLNETQVSQLVTQVSRNMGQVVKLNVNASGKYSYLNVPVELQTHDLEGGWKLHVHRVGTPVGPGQAPQGPPGPPPSAPAPARGPPGPGGPGGPRAPLLFDELEEVPESPDLEDFVSGPGAQAPAHFTVSGFLQGTAEAVGLPTNKSYTGAYAVVYRDAAHVLGLKTVEPEEYEWYVLNNGRWLFHEKTKSMYNLEDLKELAVDVEDGLDNEYNLDLEPEVHNEAFELNYHKFTRSEGLEGFTVQTYAPVDKKYPVVLLKVLNNGNEFNVEGVSAYHLKQVTSYAYYGGPMLLHLETVDDKSVFFENRFAGSWAKVDMGEYNNEGLKTKLNALKTEALNYVSVNLTRTNLYRSKGLAVTPTREPPATATPAQRSDSDSSQGTQNNQPTTDQLAPFTKWVHRLPALEAATTGDSGSQTRVYPTFKVGKVLYNGVDLGLVLPKGTVPSAVVYMNPELVPLGLYLQETVPAAPETQGQTAASVVKHHYYFNTEGKWVPLTETSAELSVTELKSKLAAAHELLGFYVEMDLSKKLPYVYARTVTTTPTQNQSPPSTPLPSVLDFLVHPSPNESYSFSTYTHVPQTRATQTTNTAEGTSTVTTKDVTPFVTSFVLDGQKLRGFELSKVVKLTVYWLDDTYPLMVHMTTPTQNKFYRNKGNNDWALLEKLTEKPTSRKLFELLDLAKRGFAYENEVDLGMTTGTGYWAKYTEGPLPMKVTFLGKLGDNYKQYLHTSASAQYPTFWVSSLKLWGAFVYGGSDMGYVKSVRVFTDLHDLPLMAEVAGQVFNRAKSPVNYTYYLFDLTYKKGWTLNPSLTRTTKMEDLDAHSLLETLKGAADDVVYLHLDAKQDYASKDNAAVTVPYLTRERGFDTYHHKFQPKKSVVLYHRGKRVAFLSSPKPYYAVLVRWFQGTPVWVRLSDGTDPNATTRQTATQSRPASGGVSGSTSETTSAGSGGGSGGGSSGSAGRVSTPGNDATSNTNVYTRPSTYDAASGFDGTWTHFFYMPDGKWSNTLPFEVDLDKMESVMEGLTKFYSEYLTLDLGARTLRSAFGVATELELVESKHKTVPPPEGLVAYTLVPLTGSPFKLFTVNVNGYDFKQWSLPFSQNRLLYAHVYSPDTYYAPLFVELVTADYARETPALDGLTTPGYNYFYATSSGTWTFLDTKGLQLDAKHVVLHLNKFYNPETVLVDLAKREGVYGFHEMEVNGELLDQQKKYTRYVHTLMNKETFVVGRWAFGGVKVKHLPTVKAQSVAVYYYKNRLPLLVEVNYSGTVRHYLPDYEGKWYPDPLNKSSVVSVLDSLVHDLSLMARETDEWVPQLNYKFMKEFEFLPEEVPVKAKVLPESATPSTLPATPRSDAPATPAAADSAAAPGVAAGADGAVRTQVASGTGDSVTVPLTTVAEGQSSSRSAVQSTLPTQAPTVLTSGSTDQNVAQEALSTTGRPGVESETSVTPAKAAATQESNTQQQQGQAVQGGANQGQARDAPASGPSGPSGAQGQSPGTGAVAGGSGEAQQQAGPEAQPQTPSSEPGSTTVTTGQTTTTTSPPVQPQPSSGSSSTDPQAPLSQPRSTALLPAEPTPPTVPEVPVVSPSSGTPVAGSSSGVAPLALEPVAVKKPRRKFKLVPVDYDKLFYSYVTLGKLVSVSRFEAVPHGYNFAQHKFLHDDAKYFANKFWVGEKAYNLPEEHVNLPLKQRKTKSLGFYSWLSNPLMVKLAFEDKAPYFLHYDKYHDTWTPRTVVNLDEELEQLNNYYNNAYVFDLAKETGKHHEYFNKTYYYVSEKKSPDPHTFAVVEVEAFEKVEPPTVQQTTPVQQVQQSTGHQVTLQGVQVTNTSGATYTVNVSQDNQGRRTFTSLPAEQAQEGQQNQQPSAQQQLQQVTAQRPVSYRQVPFVLSKLRYRGVDLPLEGLPVGKQGYTLRAYLSKERDKVLYVVLYEEEVDSERKRFESRNPGKYAGHHYHVNLDGTWTFFEPKGENAVYNKLKQLEVLMATPPYLDLAKMTSASNVLNYWTEQDDFVVERVFVELPQPLSATPVLAPPRGPMPAKPAAAATPKAPAAVATPGPVQGVPGSGPGAAPAPRTPPAAGEGPAPGAPAGPGPAPTQPASATSSGQPAGFVAGAPGSTGVSAPAANQAASTPSSTTSPSQPVQGQTAQAQAAQAGPASGAPGSTGVAGPSVPASTTQNPAPTPQGPVPGAPAGQPPASAPRTLPEAGARVETTPTAPVKVDPLSGLEEDESEPKVGWFVDVPLEPYFPPSEPEGERGFELYYHHVPYYVRRVPVAPTPETKAAAAAPSAPAPGAPAAGQTSAQPVPGTPAAAVPAAPAPAGAAPAPGAPGTGTQPPAQDAEASNLRTEQQGPVTGQPGSTGVPGPAVPAAPQQAPPQTPAQSPVVTQQPQVTPPSSVPNPTTPPPTSPAQPQPASAEGAAAAAPAASGQQASASTSATTTSTVSAPATQSTEQVPAPASAPVAAQQQSQNAQLVETKKVVFARKFSLAKLFNNGYPLDFEVPFEVKESGWAGMTVFYEKNKATPFLFALFNPKEDSGDLAKAHYDVWLYKNLKWVKTTELEDYYTLLRVLELKLDTTKYKSQLLKFREKLDQLSTLSKEPLTYTFSLDLNQDERFTDGLVVVSKEGDHVTGVDLFKTTFKPKLATPGETEAYFTLEKVTLLGNKFTGLKLPMTKVLEVNLFFRNNPDPVAKMPTVLEVVQKMPKDSFEKYKHWYYLYDGGRDWKLHLATSNQLEDDEVYDLVNYKLYENYRLSTFYKNSLLLDLDTKFTHLSLGRLVDSVEFTHDPTPRSTKSPVPKGFVLVRHSMVTENSTFYLPFAKVHGQTTPTQCAWPFSQYFAYYKEGEETPFVLVLAQADTVSKQPVHHWYYFKGRELFKFAVKNGQDVDPDDPASGEVVATKFSQLLLAPPARLEDDKLLLPPGQTEPQTPPTFPATSNLVLSKKANGVTAAVPLARPTEQPPKTLDDFLKSVRHTLPAH